MAMTSPRDDRNVLKSLHQQIDLYDRKLEHLDKHVIFATTAHHQEARNRLVVKRSILEKTARLLAASGVEFSHAELPRSFCMKADCTDG